MSASIPLYCWPFICISGAIYPSVPILPLYLYLLLELKPKSAIFNSRLFDISIFSAFMSLWQISLEWIAYNPFNSWFINGRIVLSWNIEVLDIISKKSPYGQYSVAINILFSVFCLFYTIVLSLDWIIGITLLWLILLNAVTSFINKFLFFSSISIILIAAGQLLI